MGADYNLVQIAEQAGPNFGLFASTDNELLAAGRRNVLRSEAGGNPFDTVFWNTALTGSGTVTHTAGERVIATGTTANSTAQVRAVPFCPQLAGCTQWYINVVRLSDLGVSNNIRRWGVYSDTDGFFYELNGTTMNIVTRFNGVDTRIPYSAWNGDLREWKPTDLMFMSEYEIYYGSMSCRFNINGHTVQSFPAKTLTRPLTQSLTFPFTVESINSNGQTAEADVFVRGESFHQVSPSELVPGFMHINTATTTVVKTGVGSLGSIIINTPVIGETVTVYDGVDATGAVIAVITMGGPPALAPLLYNIIFYQGLTLVTSDVADLTVTYH